jgi:hypothetical protein
MAITRINNNQITDAQAGNVYLGVNAAVKLQDYTITAGKIQNNLTYGSDLTVTGNLTVQGNTTAIDTINLVVEDPLILLAKEQTGSPALDIGFIGKRGTEDNIAWVWDESEDQFAAVFTTSEVTNTVITINSYASVRFLDLTAANANITGNLTFNGSILGNVDVTGNITGGNLISDAAVDAVTITASGNLVGGNAVITNDVSAATITASGNVLAGNVNSNAAVTGVTITASGNLEGGNAVITNDVSAATVTASGNVLAGNVNSNAAVTGVTITASGNLEGNNAVITNDVSTATVTASGNVLAGNVNSNAAVTGITITASGNLEGNNAVITNDVSAATISASGNVLAGNVNSNAAVTGVTITASGNLEGNNAVITNDVSAATISASGNVLAGNVNSNAAVTGVTITASGNLEGNNAVITNDISTTTLTASGNVSGANINTNSIVGTDIVITATSVDMNLTGNLIMSGRYINSVADPVSAQDAATKQYVDDAVSSGIHIHTPVDVETPSALPSATYANGGNTFTVNETIAGNTVVFTSAANLQVNDQLWFDNSFNGVVGNLAYFVVSTPNTSAAVLSTQYNGEPVSNITSGSGLTESVRVNSGIGATLTATTNGALIVDGFSVSAGNRVLVYNQSSAIQNGVYDVTDTGNVSAPWILTRSSDADTYEPDTSTGLDQGSYFYVKFGDTGAGESYVKTEPPGPFIFGVANIVFTQFSASQVYSANTQAGLVLNGTVFSAKVDNDTTAFDGGGNIIVKAGANLTTPNIGDATGNSLTLTGNGLLSATTVTASGNVLAGNVNSNAAVTGITITASGNLEGNNAVITNDVSAATVTASGNVLAGNVNSNAAVTGVTITASGNLEGNNAVITNDVSTATLTASGNVLAGNVNSNAAVTGVTITASGNIDGGNVNATAAVTAGTTVTATGNVVGGNLTTAGAVDATGNVTGGNINTAGQVVATGNVTGGNLNTAGTVVATGNVDGGNVNATAAVTAGTTVTATGNVVGGNLTTAGQVAATGNITGGNLITTGAADLGNIRITGNDITNFASNIITINAAGSDIDLRVSGDNETNLFIVDAGSDTVLIGTATATTGAALKVGTTDSIMVPVGNISQRPATGVTGMLRFNTTSDSLEYYDNDSWTSAGTTFTIIVADEFNGDGSTLQFTLSEDSTTAGTIVSINGVVQIPTTAYAVSGNVLTFTEAPAVTDVIDARILTTTQQVIGISNASGNAIFEGSATEASFTVQGNLIPTANVTYDLGSTSFRWRDGYFAGNSITLGNIVMKNTGGNSIGFFGPDGTTPATLDANVEVVGDAIESGTSNVSFAGANGNVLLIAGGNTTGVITATGANVAGYITATGNVTGGNLITGAQVVATGNVSGGNLTTAGLISATGNITGGNLITAGLVSLSSITKTGSNGVGNIGSSTSVFNTVFAKATSAQYADLAEMYEADAAYEPGTVVCFGGTKEVTVCAHANDRRVAGVISTNPSYLMNAAQPGEHVVPVALQGRVPCRVKGAVTKGDLMVSAGDGSAMTNNDAAVGTVIGKALEDFAGDTGVIEVVVGRF